MNHQLESALARARQEAGAAKLEAETHTDECKQDRQIIASLEAKLQQTVSALSNSAANASQLQAQLSEAGSKLAEFEQAMSADAKKAAVKAAQIRYAAWVEQQAALNRADWATKMHQMAEEQARRDEVERAHRAQEQIQANAVAAEQLKAEAAMRAANAAMIQAQNPMPASLIQQSIIHY